MQDSFHATLMGKIKDLTNNPRMYYGSLYPRYQYKTGEG